MNPRQHKGKDNVSISPSSKICGSGLGRTSKSKVMKKNMSECNLAVMTPTYADIKHKHSAGNNNWAKFTKDHNIPCFPKKPVEDSSVPVKRSKDIQNPAGDKVIEYSNGNIITRAVALDCEMVGIGEGGREDMLARVSIVNSQGDCLYDSFVKPRELVVDYRTEVSGVRPKDLEKGKDFEEVQRDVANILRKKILVGHSLKSDFSVLFLTHPKWLIRDTSKFFKEPGKGTPSLKKLAATHLGTTIQRGEHDSIQDAQAAMHLYNMFRKFWERGRGNKNRNTYSIFLRESRAKTTA